jgi:23S rRNA (uracil1939-C5)-methyltransferase
MTGSTEKTRAGVLVKTIDSRGYGMWEMDGHRFACPGILPGDEVGLSDAEDPGQRLPEILKPSPDRIKADCPWHGPCGGCDLLDLSEKARLKAKDELVRRTIGELETAADCRIHPFKASSHISRYRPRMRLHQGRNPQMPDAGYLPAKLWNEKPPAGVVPVTSCHLVMKPLARRIILARQALARLPFRIDGLSLLCSASGQEKVAGHLVVKSPTTPHRAFQAAAGLMKAMQLSGLSLGREDGRVEEIIGDIEVFGLIAPGCPGGPYGAEPSFFAQGNVFQNPLMIKCLIGMVAPVPGMKVVEGFSGAGNFSVPLVQAGAELVAIEEHPGAVRMAHKNFRRAKLQDRVTLLEGDVTALLKTGDSQADVLIVDPPRGGMAGIGAAARRLAAGRVVLVSCDLDSFGRDARSLEKSGYRIIEAAGFDLYPRTSHVEVITAFQRA